MTKEEFKAKAKEVVDNEPFGDSEVLFDYESFVEMRVAYIPDELGSSDADMPLDEFLDKLYEKIKNMALEPSADCVSRKAIVEMLNARGQGSVMTFDHFIELLYKLPSVTPTRKKGKWVETKEGKYKCSNCKGEHSDTQTGKWYEVFDFKYHYCPNCGAEMESENGSN